MPHVLVRHKVADFAKWKPVFDEHSTTRAAAGSKGGQLFRSASDPNDVTILFEWESIEKAHAFAASADLKAKMKEAGVIELPDIYFLDDGEEFSV
jgi:hypothetical protein